MARATTIRLPDQLRAKLEVHLGRGGSMNAFVADAVREKLDRERELARPSGGHDPAPPAPRPAVRPTSAAGPPLSPRDAARAAKARRDREDVSQALKDGKR